MEPNANVFDAAPYFPLEERAINLQEEVIVPPLDWRGRTVTCLNQALAKLKLIGHDAKVGALAGLLSSVPAGELIIFRSDENLAMMIYGVSLIAFSISTVLASRANKVEFFTPPSGFVVSGSSVLILNNAYGITDTRNSLIAAGCGGIIAGSTIEIIL